MPYKKRPPISILLSVAASITIAGVALAQESEPSQQNQDIPQSCQQAFDQPEYWTACAREVDPGSQLSMMAYSNLGAQAFANGDIASAARFFDLSTPADGGPDLLDAYSHALRASAYWRTGQDKKARNHAAFAMRWINEGVLGGGRDIELDDELLVPLLEVLAPVMVSLDMPEADHVLEKFENLPVKTLMDGARRAGLLAAIGAYDAALVFSAEIVSAQPDNTLFLTSHCDLLTRMGEAKDGLPYCQKALELEPENADIHFATARALGAIGNCAEADTAQDKARELAPKSPLYVDPVTCAEDE